MEKIDGYRFVEVVYGFIEVAHIWMGGTSEMKGGSELEDKRMSVEGAAHQWLFT